MSFHKVIYLYCNGNSPDCEYEGIEANSGDSPADTIAEYKEIMKSSGWLFKKGNKAYCPACRQAQKGD